MREHSPDRSGTEPDQEQPTPRPSRTRRKKESTELQDLGRQLTLLSREQLDRMELPEPVREAILAGKATTAHGALKRQIKYIGKLLRQTDAAPIRAALSELRGEHLAAARLHHRIEAWRDRLIAEGDAAIGLLAEEFPAADRPLLRRLVRGARQELDGGKAPRCARRIFQEIRRLLTEPPMGAPEP
ncbi:MAG TPA: ribosome biogenesis factor YjgA [Methylococcus sp.]|nr:ribosome biogenesis factor YjgA [Methylococcus sp.]